MQMEYNAWSYSIKDTTPTQKFYRKLINFQKPQNIKENPKPSSKCVKCMKKEGLEDHTKGKTQDLSWNPSGEGERSEEKVFGKREKKFLSSEKPKNEYDFVLDQFKQNAT